MDRYALTCPCSCHGRGPSSPCDPAFPGGCGLTHNGCPAGCGRPTADNALCASCTARLVADLTAVDDLADDLEVWRIKLDRIGGRDPRAGSNVPLGYRPLAVEVADVLHLTLAEWAREVATHAGLPLLDVPAEHPTPLAAWLARNVEHARQLNNIGAMVDEVNFAVRTVRRAIDRPADRVYAGPCDCDTDLYAVPGVDHVACRECGALYPVADRRAWLLDALREHLATAAEIAAGIGELHGEPINRKKITLWHHRERLAERGRTRNGWPLYRIGDVLDLAEQAITRAPV